MGTLNRSSVSTSVVNAPTIRMTYLTMAACGTPALGSSSCLDFPASQMVAIEAKTQNSIAAP